LNLFSWCTFRSIVSIGGRRGLLNEDRNEHVLLRHTTRPACLLINRLCIEASTDNPVRANENAAWRGEAGDDGDGEGLEPERSPRSASTSIDSRCWSSSSAPRLRDSAARCSPTSSDLVVRISDRVTVLDYGAVIAEGPPSAVQRDERVIAAYLGPSHAAA
jgi:Branched-chain amino acid ATP-binding cassette transporter